MKKLILLFICETIATIGVGQNVGIGTDEPQEKLDVNGGIRSNSIYLVGGSDSYRIVAEGAPIEIPDQQQLNLDAGVGNEPAWQSFTAGISGTLTRVQLYHYGSATGILSIYEGEGTSEPPIANVVFSTPGDWQYSSSLNVALEAGQQYTIGLSPATYWGLAISDVYPGGQNNFNTDMGFKTFMNVTSTFKVDSAGNVQIQGDMILSGNATIDSNMIMEGDLIMGDGNIGLGTSNPLYKLHLAGPDGKIRMEAGNGNVPYFSFGGTGIFSIDAENILGGRFVIKNNGNIGIGNPSPTRKLDVTGDAHISDRLGIGNPAPAYPLDVTGIARITEGLGIGTSAPSGSLRLDVTGDARVHERLGIGTYFPTASLHIKTNETPGTSCGVIASGGLAGNASIEIRGNGGTPYLDFANDSIIDYDQRLILVDDDRINVEGGELYISEGPVYATAFNVISDQRLKKDIVEVHFPISDIDQLKVYDYYYIDNGSAYPLPDALQTGLMAQEVELVYPHAVTTDSEGMKAIDYGKLTPLLLDYIQQLKAENTAIRTEFESLKEEVEWIKGKL